MFNRIAKIISGLLSAAIIFTSPSFGKIALPSAAAEELDEEALRLLWEEYLDGIPPVADIVPGPYCAALLLEDGSVQLCGVADDGSGYCRFDTREWKNMKKLDSLPNEDVPLLAGLTATGRTFKHFSAEIPANIMEAPMWPGSRQTEASARPEY